VYRNFIACTASACRLSTNRITLSDLNNDLLGLERLLKHQRRLKKLWQVIRDPVCKTTVNWVTNSIRRMTRTKLLERWCTEVGNCEVTPQALSSTVKSFMKRDGPKASTAVYGASEVTSPKRGSKCQCMVFRKPIHIS
jgi:hypothetical protein